MSLRGIPDIDAAPRTTILGAEVPARFGGVAAECGAVRRGVGMFDASFRRRWRMVGEDRVSFLQGMVSNDVKALAPGQGTYAALLTQQGRVVSDLRIYALDDAFLLDLPALTAEPAKAALERLIVADDVELEAVESAFIGIEGRDLTRLCGELGIQLDLRGLALVEADIDGVGVRVASASHMGEPGLLVACDAADAPKVWETLRGAGASPIGGEAVNTLRLEAGVPWVGSDMGEETLLMEVGIERAINFKKGCYLGQEVVERIAARGHVNRRRVGLRSQTALAAGTTLFAAGASSEEAGREVGSVTSMAPSAAVGGAIGLGLVRREQLEPGTVLKTSAGAEVVVAGLPFVELGAADWPDIPAPL